MENNLNETASVHSDQISYVDQQIENIKQHFRNSQIKKHSGRGNSQFARKMTRAEFWALDEEFKIKLRKVQHSIENSGAPTIPELDIYQRFSSGQSNSTLLKYIQIREMIESDRLQNKGKDSETMVLPFEFDFDFYFDVDENEINEASKKNKESLTQDSHENLTVCGKFLDPVTYSKILVDDIVQTSEEIANEERQKKVKETESKEQRKMETNEEKKYSTDSVEDEYEEYYKMPPSKSEEYHKKEFSQWPSAKEFELELGAFKIDEYLSSFDTEEDWLYVIYYQGKQVTKCSDLYKYQAIFSLPTWRYPIAQATASIYFVIEVCKVKPKHCPVDVTFKYETFRHTFRPGQLDFNEKWLHHILDAKINLFKTITY